MGKILEFGKLDRKKKRRFRPGAYAVLVNECGQIGVVKNPKGFFLVGGGVDRGESAEEALLREAHEEIGARIQIMRKLGEGLQHIYLPKFDEYVTKHGHFYEAKLLDITGPGEDNHDFSWEHPKRAMDLMYHEITRWAIKQVL